MKRLTARAPDGLAYYPACFSDSSPCGGMGAGLECDHCPEMEKRCERLAEYEDTGLEPMELAGGVWISVAERLPERFRHVLLCRENERGKLLVEEGFRDVEDWWKVYGTRTKRVTHWMELPAPPEEK